MTTSQLVAINTAQLDQYLIELAQAVNHIDRAVLCQVAEAVTATWRNGRTIYVMGNGGSASTAGHMVADLNKNTALPGRPRLRVVSLVDNAAWITALGNDLAYDQIFAEQLRNQCQAGDLVIAISCSGNSPNVLAGVRVARECGAYSVGLTGDQGGALKDLVDVCLFAPTAHIGQQEDIHLIVNHAITVAIADVMARTSVVTAQPVRAAILAAGEGTRLRPLTLSMPKPMVPIAGKPLLEHTVRWLVRHNIQDIAINLHYKPETITGYLKDGSALDARIVYSHEKQMLGTAGGTLRMSELHGAGRLYRGPIVLVYGDVLTNLPIDSLLAAHQRNRAHDPKTGLTMALYRVPNPTEVGLVDMDGQGKISRFVEKPRIEDVFTDLANSGVMIVEPSVLSHVPVNTFFDFGNHVFPRLLKQGVSMYGWVMPEEFYLLDIGSPEKYAQAQLDWVEESRQKRSN